MENVKNLKNSALIRPLEVFTQPIMNPTNSDYWVAPVLVLALVLVIILVVVVMVVVVVVVVIVIVVVPSSHYHLGSLSVGYLA